MPLSLLGSLVLLLGSLSLAMASDGACVPGVPTQGDSLLVPMNQRFGPGDYLCLDEQGRYKFGLDSSSQAFGYWLDDQLVWEPSLDERSQVDQGPGTWIFQSDGNLVVYTTPSLSATWWASNRLSEQPGARTLVSRGQLVITKTSIALLPPTSSNLNQQVPLWSITIPPLAGPVLGDCLTKEEGPVRTVPPGVIHSKGQGHCLGSMFLGLTKEGRFGYFDGSTMTALALWSPYASAKDSSGETWVFQEDGNLVLYNANHEPVWASTWDGSRLGSDNTLWMTQEGIAIESSQKSLLWASNNSVRDMFTPREDDGCVSADYTSSTLVPVNQFYAQGEFLCVKSPDTFYKLGLDTSGVFAIFDGAGQALWNAAATGVGRQWTFQSDGNLVVYSGGSGSTAVWASRWSHRYSLGRNYRLDFDIESGLTLRTSSSTVLWRATLPGQVEAPVPATSNDQLMYLAYYYPWYIDGDWSRHGYQDTPLLGLYGTDSVQVAEQHVDWALRAGISSWVVSWWGQDGLAKRHFEEGMLRAQNMDQMTFCMLYESKILNGYNFRDGSAQAKLRSDLLSMQADYFGHPSYLHLNGRPVVIFYITRAIFNEGFDKGVLDMLRDALGQNAYFIADEPFFGNGNCDPDTSANAFAPPSNELTVFDAYTTYNMYQDRRVVPGETASDYMLREALPIFEEWSKDTVFFPNVLPMYHDFRGKKPLVGDATDFLRQLWEVLCLPQPPPERQPDFEMPRMLFVTSFNEWWEGTQIEPDDQNRYGMDFIDVLAAFKREVEEKGIYWC